jgi:hypothetical protein
MSTTTNSISATAAAKDWDVELDGPAPTFLVFTLCVVDPLQVERVSNCFIAFVSVLSISRGVQGGNPYATITEQRERINNLIRALNNVNLHLSTSVSVSQYVSSVLLADGGDDGDDDDDNNNDDIRDPLLTSSMRRASFKCETPRLKLKSS